MDNFYSLEQVVIPESKMSEIIKILLKNLMDQTDDVDLISKKSLCDISKGNPNLLKLIVQSSTDFLKELLEEKVTEKTIQYNLDKLNNIVDLYDELIKINQKIVPKDLYKYISCFISENFSKIKGTPPNKIKMFKDQLSVIMKSYIYFSSIYFVDVIQDLLGLFPSGTIPDRLVLESLTEIAKRFPNDMCGNCKEILNRSLPLICDLKTEKSKVNFSNLFAQISEAIITSYEFGNNDINNSSEETKSKEIKEGEVLDDNDKQSKNQTDNNLHNPIIDTSNVKENKYLSSEINNYKKMQEENKELCQIYNTIYESVKEKWLQNINDQGNKLLIIRGIIMIAALAPINEKKIRLDDMCLLYTRNISKSKNSDIVMISQSYRMFLEINIGNKSNKSNFDYSINPILTSIFSLLNNPNMSPNVQNFDESFITLKSELLKILYLLFYNFFDKSFDFIINKITCDTATTMSKITSIYILSSMLLRMPNLNKDHVDKIISIIYSSMKDKDLEVRYSLCDLIYVLFDKNVVDYKNSSIFLSYLISDCGYTDKQVETYDKANTSNNNSTNNNKNNNNKLYITNLKILRDKAEHTVLDIISKIPNTLKFVFPQIFDVLWSSSILGGSYYLICQIVNDLFEKFKDEINNMEIEQNKFSKVPQPDQILVKMMIILADPTIRSNLYSISQRSFKNILTILHSDLASLVLDTSDLDKYLQKNSKFFDYNVYHEILLRQWDKIISCIKSVDYINSISKTINESILRYKYEPFICGLLLRMQGAILGRIDNRDTIRKELDNMFNIAHSEYKNDTVDGDAEIIVPKKEIRLGVGEAFGYASKTNIDFVLEKINSIFKSEIIHKKTNTISLSALTNLFNIYTKNTVNNEIIITLITCLGSICKYTPGNLLCNRVNSSILNYLDEYFKNSYTNTNRNLRIACIIAYGNLFKNLEQMSSAYLDKGNVFYLQKRNIYLNKMLTVFKEEKEISEIKIEALNNISYLIKLDPSISIEQCSQYINVAFSIFDIKNLNSINVENRDKLFEACGRILENILTHDMHINEEINEKTENDKNKKGSSSCSSLGNSFKNNEFKLILNYDKQTINQWDLISYILERFRWKYSTIAKNKNEEGNTASNNENENKNSNSILKEYIVEKITSFVNSIKNVKVNLESLDLFQNWCVAIMCLFFFSFGENNNSDNQSGLFLSICRLFTGISSYEDIDISNSETFIVQVSKILKEKFSQKNYFYLFNVLLNLMNTKIQSVSHYSSLLLTNMLLEGSDYFAPSKKDDESADSSSQLNESNNNLPSNKISTAIPDISLDVIMDKIIKILEEKISSENSTNTNLIINILDITESLSKINLDIIIYTSLNEKYGQLFPIALSTIIQNLCNDKTSISKIFMKITDIINNVDPSVDNKPNFIVCRSTVIIGTMLDSHDEIITPLIKRFTPQLLSTLLLRVGSAHSISYSNTQFITKEEDPRNQAIWALQKLMSYYDQEELSTCLESNGSIAKKLMSLEEFDEGIYEFMMIFCKICSYNEQYSMYEFLCGFINRSYFGQRLAVISCFAQFVNFSSFLYMKKTNIDINEWRNNLLNDIAKMINDTNENCRKMAMRGLGNLCNLFLTCSNDIDQYILVVNGGNEEDINDDLRNKTINTLKEELIINNYSETVVNMIIGKLDDSAECVILETLNTLQQIINYISFDTFSGVINNLLYKMRPCFDSRNFNIRALGFNLFNRVISFLPEISNFNTNNSVSNNNSNSNLFNFEYNKKYNEIYELIRDQIHANLISLMLHSIDEVLYVANNTFKVLIKGLIVILGEDLSGDYDKIKNEIGNNEKVYEDFMMLIVDKLCQKNGERNGYHINNCISHSLSEQESIRAYSSFIVGILYYYTKLKCKNYIKCINMESLINYFIKLIGDSSNKVKNKAMNSLKYIN